MRRLDQNKKRKRATFLFVILTLFSACTPPVPFHPHVAYTPPSECCQKLHSAFPCLSCEEEQLDWGRELKIGLAFAQVCDYYQAITSFKRALILIGCGSPLRRVQLQYAIVLSYYLGAKYQEALQAFDCSELQSIESQLAIFEDLLIIVYDCCERTGEKARAAQLLEYMQINYPHLGGKLAVNLAVREGRMAEAVQMPAAPCYTKELYGNYLAEKKSIPTARVLNAVLPGAGYWYVGQRASAITAFLLNGLFIAAAYHFFQRGNVAAGIITTSLESGWYLGGIYGGGRAAAEFNEQKYEVYGQKILGQECLYPQLMLRFAF